jgi:hypothetical protein
MATKKVALTGTLPKVKPDDASRLAVYVARGTEILAQGNVNPDGTFRVDISREVAAAESNFGIETVIGPAGMSGHLSQVPELIRVPIDRAEVAKADVTLKLATDKVALGDAVLGIWWRWCRLYCVSGTVIGPNGCPVPGAQVTMNTIAYTLGGYSKVPRVTVSADEHGFFKACFNWCTCGICRFCWPCWPNWWFCWPWWWELDILHILDNLERIPVKVGPPGPGPVEGLQSAIVLARPNVKDLIRGQAFVSAHQGAFAPDASRTELIKRKFNNAALRAIFPWWWWCCDDPNITFTVTQGATTILDENPATETRWCFEDNSTVVLVGNNQTIAHCGPDPLPESGFAWTRVGNIPVANIHAGYADSFGGTTDLAFGGNLDIFGGFAPGSGVSYYQVDAAQWSGDPSRGGTAPPAGSGAPIAATLTNYIYIFDGTHTLVDFRAVKMGPFTGGGVSNLYSTQEARQAAPTGTGLDPFPAIPAGGFFIWAYEGLKVSTNASNLIAGHDTGSVDLTLIGYDAAFAALALVPDTLLTLTIDNQGITVAHIKDNTGLLAYKSDGTPATQTGTGFCPAYDIGIGGYVTIDFTVSDANGHLWAYEMDAEYGHGATATVPPARDYSQAPGTFPLGYAGPPDHVQRSFAGGHELLTYYPPVSCCYEFRIRAGKRVTDGYNGPSYGDYDFQTISLKVA